MHIFLVALPCQLQGRCCAQPVPGAETLMEESTWEKSGNTFSRNRKKRGMDVDLEKEAFYGGEGGILRWIRKKVEALSRKRLRKAALEGGKTSNKEQENDGLPKDLSEMGSYLKRHGIGGHTRCCAREHVTKPSARIAIQFFISNFTNKPNNDTKIKVLPSPFCYAIVFLFS